MNRSTIRAFVADRRRGDHRRDLFFASPALAQAVKAATSAKPPAAKVAAFDATPCLGCHAPVKALYDSGKHKGVGCNTCHDGTAAHLADASKRPTTKTDLANCGGCHQNQYQTYAQMDWHRTARFEKKQMTGPAPDPSYDLLMSPHGFTKEHNLPRAHTFALLDQFVVDRAFGGRFAPKESGAISRAPATSTSGTSRRPVPRQHRPEGVQAGHGRGGESGVPVLQDAGPHPRMGVHGRPGAQREVEPHVEGRRARQGVEPCAQLHLLPRPARGEAAHRPRRADRGGDAHRFRRRSTRRTRARPRWT